MKTKSFSWYSPAVLAMTTACCLIWAVMGTALDQIIIGGSIIYLSCIAIKNLQD